MGSGLWSSMYDCFYQYVPPCERNPYYDDPRDVKPEERADNGATIKIYQVLELIECDECHSFFQPDYISQLRPAGSRNICPECQKKGGN